MGEILFFSNWYQEASHYVGLKQEEYIVIVVEHMAEDAIDVVLVEELGADLLYELVHHFKGGVHSIKFDKVALNPLTHMALAWYWSLISMWWVLAGICVWELAITVHASLSFFMLARHCSMEFQVPT